MVEKADKLTHKHRICPNPFNTRAFFQFVDLRRKSWIHFYLSFLRLAHDILSMFGTLNGMLDNAIRFHISLAFMIFRLFVYLAFFFNFLLIFPELCSVIAKSMYWTASCIEFDIRQYFIRSSHICHSEMFT